MDVLLTATFNEPLCCNIQHAQISSEGQRDRIPDPTYPQENHKAIGFLQNYGPEPLENHNITQPEFNVWTSSAFQRNAMYMKAP